VLEGFKVDCAPTGTAGLVLARTRAYDEILLDLRLPDIPGLDILRYLRAQGIQTPVLVLTGYLDLGSFVPGTLGPVDIRYKTTLFGDELVAAARAMVERGPVLQGRALGRHLVIPGHDDADANAGRKPPDRQAISSHTLDAEIADLHDRVIAEDRAAVNELAQRLLQRMQPALQRAFPRAPSELIVNAIEDTILEYVARPTRFDRTRGVRLDTFLAPAARRNLLNVLQREARRQRREAKYAEEARILQNVTFEPVVSERGWNPAVRREMIAAAATGAERPAVVQWLNGERGTAPLAAALGLSHLPALDQRREVKRFKDRIIRRLMRHFRGYRPPS
jgi:DNA-binding response OmpR family regulator